MDITCSGDIVGVGIGVGGGDVGTGVGVGVGSGVAVSSLYCFLAIVVHPVDTTKESRRMSIRPMPMSVARPL
jgi:hypothetical protein